MTFARILRLLLGESCHLSRAVPWGGGGGGGPLPLQEAWSLAQEIQYRSGGNLHWDPSALLQLLKVAPLLSSRSQLVMPGAGCPLYPGTGMGDSRGHVLPSS
jgi:hypothetical protein